MDTKDLSIDAGNVHGQKLRLFPRSRNLTSNFMSATFPRSRNLTSNFMSMNIYVFGVPSGPSGEVADMKFDVKFRDLEESREIFPEI